MSLLSVLCMLIARMEMGTSRVSGDFDTVWSPVTDHYVNKVKKLVLTQNVMIVFMLQIKEIISSND